MEKLVFYSPKKHRIIAIKELLAKNNISTTSIKLYFYLELNRGAVYRGGEVIIEKIEKRDELNISIEEFNEKLNSSQTFELYVNEKHEDLALELIENIDIEVLFNDCIFKSNNYDEVFEKYLLLTRNNIQCDDIFTNNDEYLLFIDPENKQEALNIIEPKKKKENIYEYKKETQNNYSRIYENNEKNPLKYILPIIIILLILFLKINNEFIIEIIMKKIGEIIKIN